MRTLAITIGVLFVCLSQVEGHHRRKKNLCEDQVVPTNICANGLFDPLGCQCQCNSIGPIDPVFYCWINEWICATKGTPLSGDCCVERQAKRRRKGKGSSHSHSSSSSSGGD